MYFVYAICSLNRNYIYVGITDNVIRRFHQHNSGFEKTTKPYKPFILIYTEVCETRQMAREREIYFKNSSGKVKLRKIREQIIDLYSSQS